MKEGCEAAANSPSGSSDATERLLDRMGKTANNEEFLTTLTHEVESSQQSALAGAVGRELALAAVPRVARSIAVTVLTTEPLQAIDHV